MGKNRGTVQSPCLRQDTSTGCGSGDENGELLGYTNGFIVPIASYMHCEALQVFSDR